MTGPIALVGGNEWTPPAAPLDSWLLERSKSKVVTVLPTAAQPEGNPELAVETAAKYFSEMGAEVHGLMVMTRQDADDGSQAQALSRSRFIYLAGGDPGYLAKTLRDTRAWHAIVEANKAGAVLAGSSAGAMVLFDRMLRRVGRSMESGLGLLKGSIVLPHHDQNLDRLPKIFEITGSNARLLGIDECTGLTLEGSKCRVLGAGSVSLYEEQKLAWKALAPTELTDAQFKSALV